MKLKKFFKERGIKLNIFLVLFPTLIIGGLNLYTRPTKVVNDAKFEVSPQNHILAMEPKEGIVFNSIVHEVFYHAMTNPSGFDNWVARNMRDRKYEFSNCLQPIKKNLIEIEPPDCIPGGPCPDGVSDVLMALNSAEAVIMHGVPFRSTTSGASLINGEIIGCQWYGCEYHRELMKWGVNIWAFTLTCQ